MSKPKAQGTAWESALVRQIQDAGLGADRLPEGGMRDAGDIWIHDTPRLNPNNVDIPVVAWSRLVDNGSGRRVADGARAVIVLSVPDFLTIIRNLDDIAFVVECKATERLNVTRTRDQGRRKLANWKRR